MSILQRLVPNLITTARYVTSQLTQKSCGFHSLTSKPATEVKPGGLFDIVTRNVIRIHFPRPSERKRVKRHGWKHRMSTREGRRILMNRILKGELKRSNFLMPPHSKSEPAKADVPPESNEDLEDGEIEDDGDDEVPVEASAPEAAPDAGAQNTTEPTPKVGPNDPKPNPIERVDRDRPRNKSNERPDRHRHDERDKKKHMTEAEKSILHLRKRERMQRELYSRKESKYNFVPDDFARNLEKSLASVLKKDKPPSEDEKEEEKRGKKRKKQNRDKPKKMKKTESPKSEEIDENEMLNIQGGSPTNKLEDKRVDKASPTNNSEDSFESEYSSDNNGRERRRDFKNKHKGKNRRDRKNYRDRSRERRESTLKDSQGVCVFYLQGKCQKNDCPYSHEAIPPMKLELCKFYLMDCCAKGEKCLYMHQDFPCKFYHTGLQCLAGDNCKFAHGKPLSDGLKQILFKHIETAPRDILGGFPRMSREEALNMINNTQKGLVEKFGEKKDNNLKGFDIPCLFDIDVPIPPELKDETVGREKPERRNRPSRWQDSDGENMNKNQDVSNQNFDAKPFSYGKDQDMRIHSNGDVDMRTLPPTISAIVQPLQNLPNSSNKSPERQSSDTIDIEQYKREAGYVDNQPKDIDIRTTLPSSFSSGDVDIRQQMIDPRLLSGKDVDIRQLSGQNEEPLMIDLNASANLVASVMDTLNIPHTLPKTQRDLFMRIKAQQKDVVPEAQKVEQDNDESNNINWYSDDDDDDENRLMIKVDNDDVKEEPEKMETEVLGFSVPTTTPLPQIISPPILKPQEVVEKLGDLSKIDISAEVTKLLSSISKSTMTSLIKDNKPAAAAVRDPRQAAPAPSTSEPRFASSTSSDPRRSARNSTETPPRPEKLSIYEQGGLDMESKGTCDDLDFRKLDSDLRGIGRPDIDLRNLQLPFKGMQNYTPATEIDASVNSHLPMAWRLMIVDVPRPDYTGLKLSIADAEKTGDPRLRKIFRLASTEEKESPASPKASPKASSSGRVDPRLKKLDEIKSEPVTMTYMQQLNMLQSSAFYQSLTSNQKLLLNQELSVRSDQTGSHDPVLNSLLTNLNIISGSNPASQNTGAALNILANVTKLNPMLVNNPLVQTVNAQMLAQNTNMLTQMAQGMSQPGLLGAAPGIPNMPSEFQMNFDPRNGGLLGNAPNFSNFQQEAGNFGNFNEEFYQGEGPNNNFGNPRNERGGFNRDRRRGRGNFNNNRSGGNRHTFRNRNNNRTNRGHTPP